AAACNRGLAAVDTACVAFLNNDVFVTPNWQTPLLDALARDEDVAICQPKLLSAKNAGYFDYAGAAGGLSDRYGYPFFRRRIFHVGSATWDSMAVRRAYLLHRNSIIVLLKNCPRSDLGLVLGARYFLELASAAYFFVGGHPDRAASVLRALVWNLWRSPAT